MIDKLSASLNFYQQALNLRADRQEVLSANIANADTPNYKARDFDFKTELDNALGQGRMSQSGGGLALQTTSSRHLNASAGNFSGVQALDYRIPAQPSLDGNTVDMDMERVNFADNAVHYQANLQILGNKIKGLKTAMQPE